MRRVLIFAFLVLIAGSSLAEVRLTADITRLGVGARPLGMGKMFTGLADDISAMYLNPAGLAQLKTPQILSMSGKFVNSVNYLTLAAVSPTRFGTVGIGYAGAGIGFSTPVLQLTEIATGEYRVIPSTTEAVSYDYDNYAIALTYGTSVLRPDLSVGATLKLFTETISGASKGSSSGYDLDLGLMFKPNPNLTLGVLGKSILPYDLGGKIKWDTGLEEAIPASVNLGASYKMKNITVGADYEFRPKQTDVPGYWHAGIEWWLTEIFALRAGVDQDVVGKGSGDDLAVTSNPTAGLSLLFRGFSFDYAFHRYNDIAANDTHYFSLSYLFPEMTPKIPFTLSEPKDKFVTDEEKIWVTGEVIDQRRVHELRINDKPAYIAKQGKFAEETPLILKLNRISVEAYDNEGKLLQSGSAVGLRLKSFADVKPPYFAVRPIEFLATLDIISGYPDGSFKPLGNITRAEMCTLLMKIRGIGDFKVSGKPFRDIQVSHWAADYIGAAYRAAIVMGYKDGTFRPNGLITRAEGVTMIGRFEKLTDGEVLEAPYADVPGRHWAASKITLAKEAGWLKYLEGKNFEPQKPLTRGEVAEILFRTGTIQEKAEALWKNS